MGDWRIIVVFIMGAILVLAALIAFFTPREEEGKARFKFLGAIDISGSGCGLFLVVGALFMLVGIGWDGTKQLKDKSNDLIVDLIISTSDATGEIPAQPTPGGQPTGTPPSTTALIERFSQDHQLSPKMQREIERRAIRSIRPED